MANQELRTTAGGCAGGLIGAIVGAALPFAWFMLVEGGQSGPTANNFITFLFFTGIGAVVGGFIGMPLGVAAAWAIKKPEVKPRARAVTDGTPGNQASE